MLESAAVRALLLSLAAGLSTLLGALVVFAARRRSEKLLAVSLGFAGGVMLAVSFTDLFPTAREHLTASLGGRPGALGGGAVPGRGHRLRRPPWTTWFPTTPLTPTPARPHTKTCSGWALCRALAMALHNFPEGVATFLAGYEDLTLGVSITLAIALHNIPEGISVAMPRVVRPPEAAAGFLLHPALRPDGARWGRCGFALLRSLSQRAAGWGCCSARWRDHGLYRGGRAHPLLPAVRPRPPALWATLCGICVMPLTHLFQT